MSLATLTREHEVDGIVLDYTLDHPQDGGPAVEVVVHGLIVRGHQLISNDVVFGSEAEAVAALRPRIEAVVAA